MSANLIDGKALAGSIRQEIKEEISQLSTKPGLAVIMVGDNPSSEIYVRNKQKACEEVGIKSFSYHLPATATQQEVENLVLELASCERNKSMIGVFALPDAQSVPVTVFPRGIDFSSFAVCVFTMGKVSESAAFLFAAERLKITVSAPEA